MNGAGRTASAVKHQHYVPEFYLKRFAYDARRLKVRTVSRRQDRLVDEERSIEYTCFEKRIYRDREGAVTSLENLVQRSAA